MELSVVYGNDIRKLLPIDAAIDAVEEMFRASGSSAPARNHLDVGTGELLLMPAWGKSGVGVKLVTVNPSNPEAGLPLVNGIYLLFDRATLQPVLVADAAVLTGIRTAAVSAVATRHLARADSSRLVIFGAGVQARHHLEAMLAVRPFEEVVCVSRSAWRADEFVVWARTLGCHARAGTPDAVADADVVCTCTTSPAPVFDGAWIADGAHVNAIGSYQPHTRELDSVMIRRARIIVETRAAALAEAGDLLIPIAEGAIAAEDIVADLAEVVGGALVRNDRAGITVFKSVGIATEDLAVATALHDRII